VAPPGPSAAGLPAHFGVRPTDARPRLRFPSPPLFPGRGHGDKSLSRLLMRAALAGPAVAGSAGRGGETRGWRTPRSACSQPGERRPGMGPRRPRAGRAVCDQVHQILQVAENQSLSAHRNAILCNAKMNRSAYVLAASVQSSSGRVEHGPKGPLFGSEQLYGGSR